MKIYKLSIILILFSAIGIFAKGNTDKQLEKAQKAYNSQNFKQALTIYDQILKGDKSNRKALLGRAMTNIVLGELQSTIADMNYYLTLDTLNPDAYNYLGYARLYSDSSAQSIDDFTKVITLDSNYTEAYINRAIANMTVQLDPLSAKDLEKAISLSPKNPLAHKYYAYVSHRLKEYEKSIEHYTLAITYGYNSPDVYQQRGNSHFKLKQFQDAINDYSTALKGDPENADILNNRATAYHYIGKEDSAQADKQRAEVAQNKFLQSIGDNINITYSRYFSDAGKHYEIFLPTQFNTYSYSDSFALVQYITREKISGPGEIFTLGALIEYIDSTQTKLGLSSVQDLLGYFKDYQMHCLSNLLNVRPIHDKQKQLSDNTLYQLNKSVIQFPGGNSPDFMQYLVAYIKEGKIIIVRFLYPMDLEFKYEAMIQNTIATFKF